jgi:fructose-1,6-bisphosphatase/inositol monophosphatase family enzyme
MNQDLKEYLKFAKEMAKMAADTMYKYYRANERTITHKADKSVVTIADMEINHRLIEEVQKRFPKHGVLGEEESYKKERNQLWVCDPIDGTASFVHHVPTSTFSLAYVEDGEPLLGLAYNPWTKDMYWATKGQGAFRNGQRLEIATASCNPDGREAMSACMLTEGDRGWPRMETPKFKVVPGHGMVFKCCLVAEGSTNGQIFEGDTTHDVAAVACIIKEAGGKVTDIDGNEQRYDRPVNGFIGSDGRVHDELIELVKQARRNK